MGVEYPIRAVAKLTGISVDTLRAWERRYGAVVPDRKGRGRVYSEKHVQRLVRLRQAVDRGHSIGQIAHLDDADLDELVAGPDLREEASRKNTASRHAPPRALPVLEAIERFDVPGVEQEIFRLASLMPSRELVHEVILPLLREVGDRWHQGEFSVAQEHLASAVTRNLLGTLIRTGTPHPRSARVLIAAPAGELHEFGILASALLAVGRGLNVTYLGTNLPGREVIDAALRIGVDAVLIGVSNPKPPQGVIDEVHLVVSGLSDDVSLWIGGSSPETLLRGVSRANLVVISDFESLEKHLEDYS